MSVLQWLKTAARLTFDTIGDFQKNQCSLMAAGLAYYLLISASPLFVVAISVVGSILGREAAKEAILVRVADMFGHDAAATVSQLLQDTALFSGGLVPSLIAVVVLLYGSTRAFAALQGSLDTIWGVPRTTSIGLGLLQILRTRLIAFLLVLALGLVMLATMMLETIGSTLALLIQRYTTLDPGWGLSTGRLTSLLVRSLGLAIIYRRLPACKIDWRDVWLAGLVAGVLLSFGHTLIGLYVYYSGVKSAYGAAGSIIILLFSFYYAAFVVLLGAQFPRVRATYRHRYDS